MKNLKSPLVALFLLPPFNAVNVFSGRAILPEIDACSALGLFRHQPGRGECGFRHGKLARCARPVLFWHEPDLVHSVPSSSMCWFCGVPSSTVAKLFFCEILFCVYLLLCVYCDDLFISCVMTWQLRSLFVFFWGDVVCFVKCGCDGRNGHFFIAQGRALLSFVIFTKTSKCSRFSKNSFTVNVLLVSIQNEKIRKLKLFRFFETVCLFPPTISDPVRLDKKTSCLPNEAASLWDTDPDTWNLTTHTHFDMFLFLEIYVVSSSASARRITCVSSSFN